MKSPPGSGRSTFGLVLLLMLLGCGDSDGNETEPPPGNEIWKPTTVPYDPDCATGCQTLEQGNFGHLGELEVAINPDVDDPIAQWADCLESFQNCLFAGESGLACSQKSSCPASCRSDFETRIKDVTDPKAQHEAFEAVYVVDGAPCLPAIEEVTN